jgi:hypothetical protein
MERNGMQRNEENHRGTEVTELDQKVWPKCGSQTPQRILLSSETAPSPRVSVPLWFMSFSFLPAPFSLKARAP